MGDKPEATAWNEKKARGLELEALSEKQTSGRSEAGPESFEPTDGIGFSASILAWLGRVIPPL